MNDLRHVAKELGLTSSRFEYKDLSENAEYYINRSKKEDRPTAHSYEWVKDQLYKVDLDEKLLKQCPDEIERIDCKDYTVEEFIEKYESKNKPVVIRGLAEGWKREKYWTFEEMYQRYKDEKFKVGEDDEGYPIRIKLKYFFEYMRP